MAWLRFKRRCVLIVIALFVLSGCAAPPPAPLVPTLASPYVISVCVRQPNVPKNVQWWGLSNGGTLVVEDWELASMQERGSSIYHFDPYAPPESVAFLPIPYNKLECPKPPPKILAAPTLPRKRDVVAKKADEKKTGETKQAEAKAEAKPPPPEQRPSRVASPTCEEVSEPGQRRARSGTGRTCVRSRVLTKRGAAEDPPKATAAVKPPEKAPTRERKPEAYEDWGLDEPDVSGLDPERAKECIGQLCHARHPNFIPKKGKEPEKPREGQSWSTGGNGSGKAPSAGPPKSGTTRKSPLSRPSNGKTTVKTTEKASGKTPKSPESSPNRYGVKKDGTPRAKPGPKTDDAEPHNAKVIEERNKLEAEGNRVVNGGRKPGLREERVPIEGGKKTIRRPDITYETPDGQKRGRNVGETNADGTPKTREQDALDDLNNHSPRKTDFVPYDR